MVDSTTVVRVRATPLIRFNALMVSSSAAMSDTGLEAAMAELPSVEDCWRVAGSEGYVLKVRVPDIRALEDTISALNRIRGVARTRTTVVLSTKWEGRHG